MNIQDLVRERVIGNIKTGKKNEKGIPEKLPYFHVEEDKGTSYDMVEIFKQLYPGQPTKLKIRFTSENPFNFKFKRYVNGKAVCIGNEDCSHRQSGKCKLKGTLKFALDGIEAGGVWNLSTSGGISLSNIASEIVKYKRAGMSIVGVPFELTLTEQQSLAYGTYYSIDLHRTDIKPQLVTDALPKLAEAKEENKQLADKTTIKEKDKKETSKVEKAEQIQPVKEEKENAKIEETKKDSFSNRMTTKKFMPTLVKGNKFDKIIFQDMNNQDVEYILHPRANQDILKYGVGTIIEVESAKVEENMNILCKYKIIQIINPDGTVTEFNDEELKKAV